MVLGRLLEMKDDKRTPSGKGAQKNSISKFNRKSPLLRNKLRHKPVKPDNYLTNSLLSALPNPNTQTYEFLKIICINPDSLTGSCNPLGGVNLSSVAKIINKYIAYLGYVVDCRQPEVRKKNRHGNLSNQFYWGIYKL